MILFALAFTLSFTIRMAFLEPTLTFQAELWAEAGTNYLYVAQTIPFFESLKVLDFGYLPLLQRIAGHLIYRLSPLEYIPHAFQWIGIVFSSLCCAIPCLPLFRKLFLYPSHAIWISFLLSCNLTYDQNTFINFPYWAIVPIFYYALHQLSLPSNPEHLGQRRFVEIFIFLSLLSKGVYFVLVPFWMALILYDKYLAIDKKFRPWNIAFLAASLLQFFVLVLNRASVPAANQTKTLLALIEAFFINLLGLAQAAFGQTFDYLDYGLWSLIPILVSNLILIWIVKKSWNLSSSSTKKFLVFFILISLPALLISVVTFPVDAFHTKLFADHYSFSLYNLKTWSVAFTVFYLGLVHMILGIYWPWIKHKKHPMFFVFLLFFVLFKSTSVFRSLQPQTAEGLVGFANWQRDKEKFLEGEYCIQLNPESFKMGAKCP